jgi:hypothetical protein
MRPRPRALRALAAVACATGLLGVTACSKGAPPTAVAPGSSGTTSPRPAVDLTVVPTPAASTTTPAPTMPTAVPSPTPPPEMAQDDEVGAVAAATYFLDLYTYTESTQDTGPWEAMSHDDCVFCQSVLDDVARTRSAGQVVHATTMDVQTGSRTMLNPLAYSIELDVTSGPDSLWTSDGRMLQEGSRAHGRMTVVVVYHATEWLVREVQLDPDQ